ncbi:MAG: 5-methyltetrahydropteroyltriglutamate--homocysteine S-methyltransferase [Alphaproteobacteria bacterium]|nr:5-methyltetrahydropteroyltriglutamate--homocysteine S-methyltransferase [Alphaproteobacteria bacterium]
MVLATNLGFPRIGAQRELKKAVESFWKGESSPQDLMKTAEELCIRHWKLQQKAGIQHIPSNDFSFYDQILDMTCTLGAFPERFKKLVKDGKTNLEVYFAMARGNKESHAMEMTKWFDTNYHYLVPELTEDMEFKLSSDKVFNEFIGAKNAGIKTRPVLVGPMTWLISGKKMDDGDYCRCTLLLKLVPVYIEILKKLQGLGAEWVQIDEPALVLDLKPHYKDAYKTAYAEIAKAVPGIKILLATYFDGLRDNNDLAFGLPVTGVHIDLCRTEGKSNISANKLDVMVDAALAKAGDKVLSLGLVDGRNIWKNDLSTSLAVVEKAAAKLGSDKIFVAGSCSLLHSPVDLANETALDKDIKSWMAFATQKLDEIAALAKPRAEIADRLKESDAVVKDRKTSKRIHNDAVQKRMKDVTPAMAKRKSVFKDRQKIQHTALNLPLFPTTSIGSFPQTEDIRKARADFKAGKINEAAYKKAMQDEIKKVVDYQHAIDIDVLVHGEPERNDMVEYFGEQLAGFTFTKNGWVQSYGSRCVKPPVIFGDVSRPKPMTVEWSKYAQSLTNKVMKGMLTGPITILQWSFVRDDQPRSETAKQIALAIRDEVVDLEKAGIRMIQIDEAAIREGLPLRQSDWKQYLDKAVENFRITASGVEDKTQIHTHMCYSDFNSIIDSVAAMDADVISIETSRSHMELLDAFVAFKYPNEIGPGVYDIHSPRIPSKEEMVELLDKAAKVIDVKLLWVNPDCGLKTRGWKEVEPALKNMVAAAKEVRVKYAKSVAA